MKFKVQSARVLSGLNSIDTSWSAFNYYLYYVCVMFYLMCALCMRAYMFVLHIVCVHVCIRMCCYGTCINVPMPFITYSRLWLLAELPVLASHMTLIWTNGVTCLLHVFCIPHKMEGSALDMGIIESHWSR